MGLKAPEVEDLLGVDPHSVPCSASLDRIEGAREVVWFGLGSLLEGATGDRRKVAPEASGE